MSFWMGAAGPIAGAGANLLGGLLGSSGAAKANRQNRELVREQMRFQERMSSTAYQRAAADLEKAGLNRILALGSPASSPGGATATMQNTMAPLQAGIAGAGSSALEVVRTQDALKTARSTRAQIGTQIRKARSEIKQILEQTRALGFTAEFEQTKLKAFNWAMKTLQENFENGNIERAIEALEKSGQSAWDMAKGADTAAQNALAGALDKLMNMIRQYMVNMGYPAIYVESIDALNGFNRP